MARITWLAGVLVSALAIAGVCAGGASAVPATLHLYYIQEGVEHELTPELTPEQQIEAYDTHWRVQAAEEYVECNSSARNTGFFTEDETNNQKTDDFFVEQTFGTFYANSSCSSTMAFVGPEAEGSWYNPNYPSSPENVYVQAQIKLSAKEKAEYVSDGKKDNVIEFRASGAAGARCYYEVTKLKGTLDALPGTVRANFNNQKLKLLKMNTSDVHCPKKATVSTSMTMYVEAGGSELTLYGRVS
jgi:hypothetical protein